MPRPHAIALVALLAAAAAAGCAGDQLLSVGTSTPDTAPTTTASTTAYGDASASAKSAFPANPLTGEVSERPAGGREVMANPSIADIMQPGPLPEMAWGRADAPVTVIKYMSLTCPYCRKFHAEVFPAFKTAYIETGKVRFILREFPIGRTSGNATIALRCAAPEKYLDLYGKFLAEQSKWVSQEVRLDAIHAVAQQVGMTRARLDECLKNQAMIDGLKWVKDRGRTLGIIGTPNFFVDGKLVKRVLTLADLAALVEAALAAKGATARAVTPH